MAVYDGEKYLQEAVDSILAQTFQDFEFIIVNDGSSDATRNLLEGYAKKDPRIKIYHQEHLGLAASLNYGCSLAQADYIARMDADDISLPDRFMKQLDYLEKYPHLVVLGGGVDLIDDQGRKLGSINQASSHLEIRKILISANPVFHPTVMMRRKAWMQIGGYRKQFQFAEDYDLWVRMILKYEIQNMQDTLLKYRIRSGQANFFYEKQAWSALAIQASMHSEYNAAIASSCSELNPSHLKTMGISEDVIKKSVMTHAFQYANFLLSLHQRAAYSNFSKKIITSTSPENGRVLLKTIAGPLFFWSKRHLLSGQWMEALMNVVLVFRILLNNFLKIFKFSRVNYKESHAHH